MEKKMEKEEKGEREIRKGERWGKERGGIERGERKGQIDRIDREE